jgi:tRNA U34 5-carboxymethylaminomethyl modifying GTPase MnmE/TrmE
LKTETRLEKAGVAKAEKWVKNRICRILVFKNDEKRNKKEENLLKKKKER